MFCCVSGVGRCFCGEECVTGEMGSVVMQVFRQSTEGSQVSGQVRCMVLYRTNICCVFIYTVFLSEKNVLCILSLTFWLVCVPILEAD